MGKEQKGHNRPPVTVEFTREQAEFVLHNADTNFQAGLRMIGNRGIDRQMAERVIEQMDRFKEILKIMERALK